MICLLSFIVFGFLGIFFARYRELAREAFSCLVQRAKTGECEADFDTKVKSSVVGKAMKHDRRLARFLNNHLEKVTWLILVIFLVSGIYAVGGVYNWAVYGNCNGPSSDEGCALNQMTPAEKISERLEVIPSPDSSPGHSGNETGAGAG